MNLNNIQKRLKKIENPSVSVEGSPKRREAEDSPATLIQLQELLWHARCLMLRAAEKGDERTAISALQAMTKILELKAKLSGELREDPTINVLNVEIGDEVAHRIAQTFMDRHPRQELP